MLFFAREIRVCTLGLVCGHLVQKCKILHQGVFEIFPIHCYAIELEISTVCGGTGDVCVCHGA